MGSRNFAPAANVVPHGDVILVVGSNENAIRVSSNIIVSHSPVFRVMLTGRFKEATDFKNTTTDTVPYELRLPDDNYEGLLLLCQILYHQAQSAPEWLHTTPYQGRDILSRVLEELKRFRHFAVAVDKYHCLTACKHLSTNWLSALLRWTDLININRDYHEINLQIRFAIIELAYLLNDPLNFTKATSLAIYNSGNVRGLDDWSDYIGVTHPSLPDSFYTVYYQRRAKYWTQLHAEISKLRDFLSLGGAQPCLSDIKQTTIHGYWFNRVYGLSTPFDSATLHDQDKWGIIQGNYRVGTHDIMLLGGYSVAVNRVIMKEVDTRKEIPMSTVVKELSTVKCQPFASIRTLESKPHWKWCRACEFDADKCLKEILDKFPKQIQGLCLKCVARGIDDCASHEKDNEN